MIYQILMISERENEMSYQEEGVAKTAKNMRFATLLRTGAAAPHNAARRQDVLRAPDNHATRALGAAGRSEKKTARTAARAHQSHRQAIRRLVMRVRRYRRWWQKKKKKKKKSGGRCDLSADARTSWKVMTQKESTILKTKSAICA